MGENVINNYGWSSAKESQTCAYLTPRVVELLQKLHVQRVLDVGTGNGALCGQLQALGYQVRGIDYDSQGIAIARVAYPDIPFYQFGVQDDPAVLLASEQPFDAVVSTEVVEHLFSPHLLPIYAAGVLRPGGYLIISTPYHGYWKNLALALSGHWDAHLAPMWHGGHIKFWSRASLSQLLIEHGFRVIGFQGIGRFPYLWKSMMMIGQKI